MGQGSLEELNTDRGGRRLPSAASFKTPVYVGAERWLLKMGRVNARGRGLTSDFLTSESWRFLIERGRTKVGLNSVVV